MDATKIEKIRYWISSNSPKWMFEIAVKGRAIYKSIKYPEKRKTFGPLNPDKTFYVIRLVPPGTGFLANYNYVLGYMKYALDKGWHPVIDMENYATLYQEDEPYNDTRNVWEYYFEQPLDVSSGKRYSLDEVYKSKNVVLAKGDAKYAYTNSMEDDVLKWKYELSKLIPFNKKTQDHIASVKSAYFPKSGKTLAVSTRQTDMKKRIIGHPIPTTTEEMVEIAKNHMSMWKMDNVYVKAEEEKTIDYFSTHIDNLYYSEAQRIVNYDYKGGTMIVMSNNRISKADSLLDYLTDIAIMSECDAIIGDMNNGIMTAIIWNGNKYQHYEILENEIWK